MLINGVTLTGVVTRAPVKRHGFNRGLWAMQTMDPMVINGTIEVKPGGESTRRIGTEVTGAVDLGTTTRQPISIMVGDHLVSQAATRLSGPPAAMRGVTAISQARRRSSAL